MKRILPEIMKPILTAIVPFLVLLSACKQQSDHIARQPVPDRWEYKEVTSFSKDTPVAELNRMGAEGWELVTLTREREKGFYTTYLFKRRATEPDKRSAGGAVVRPPTATISAGN